MYPLGQDRVERFTRFGKYPSVFNLWTVLWMWSHTSHVSSTDCALGQRSNMPRQQSVQENMCRCWSNHTAWGQMWSESEGVAMHYWSWTHGTPSIYSLQGHTVAGIQQVWLSPSTADRLSAQTGSARTQTKMWLLVRWHKHLKQSSHLKRSALRARRGFVLIQLFTLVKGKKAWVNTEHSAASGQQKPWWDLLNYEHVQPVSELHTHAYINVQSLEGVCGLFYT